jgi:hypothetical protein
VNSEAAYSRDLFVLVPDKNYVEAVRALLDRHVALGIRAIGYDIFAHAHRDPGCLREAHDFLRQYLTSHARALVMFDREGCGCEDLAPAELEAQVQTQLDSCGWAMRSAVLVLDPELEAWVWGPSREVPRSLGWSGQQQELRRWLEAKALWAPDAAKPDDPKRAVEEVLRETRTPRSSAIYGGLASRAGLRRCSDPAFGRFCETMRTWFSVQ